MRGLCWLPKVGSDLGVFTGEWSVVEDLGSVFCDRVFGSLFMLCVLMVVRWASTVRDWSGGMSGRHAERSGFELGGS